MSFGDKMSIKPLKDCYCSLDSKKEEFNKKKEERTTNLQKISDLKKIIPTIDEELIFWKEEIKRIENNPQMQEEFILWSEEVKKLENEKNIKKSDLKKFLKSNKKIKENLTSLENNIHKISESLQKNSLIVLKLKINELTEDEILEVLKILKDLFEYNGNKKKDMFSFISFLTKSDINTDTKLLKIIAKLFEENIDIISEKIVAFIYSFIKNNSVKVLDLWPSNGYALISLFSNIESNYITYLNDETKPIFQNLLSSENVTCEHIDKLNVKNQILDLIIGYVPNDNTIIDYEIDNSRIISDKKTYIHFLKACENLNNNGKAFLIIDSKFILNRGQKSVFSNMCNKNLFINAIFDLSEFNSPFSDLLLILFSHNSSKKIFVGSISKNERNNKLLKKNYNLKKEGEIPLYGSYISLDDFYAFKTFFKTLELKKYFQKKNLETKTLSNSSNEINYDANKYYDDIPNSIYIPYNDSLDVTTSLEKIKNNKTKYFQVVFDPEKVFNEYIAKYLNTALGIKIRTPLSLQTSNEDLLLDMIHNIEFYLPKLEDQLEIIRTEAFIRDINTKANYQRDELWRNPDNYREIRELLRKDNSESQYTFEKWVESLPFPLSSILWECITTPKYEHKVKYLLHFFEAFSELNVIILLSGLISDSYFFKEKFSNCITNQKFPYWFYSPSFGNWNFLGRCLSRRIKSLSYYEYNFSKCLGLFGDPEREFILNLTSERLYDLLHEVLKNRNSWDAHGPVVNEDLYKNRYEILRNSLSKFYEIIGNTFENTFLVLPGGNEYKDGTYFYTIRKFIGANPKFKSFEIKTTVPMDSDRIYIYSKDQTKPIELLSIIIFFKDTCYFFNNKDKISNQVQYVSYHNKEKPELEFPESVINHFTLIFEK